MIYFDNAATGGFKPYSVINETQNALKYVCANPGRSSHKLSIEGADIVYSCRKTLAEFLGTPISNIIFAKNCTEALNIAILGTVKKGGHVITTVFEHNSVLRPLYFLKNKGYITLDIVSPTPTCPLDKAILDKITDNTYLIVHTLASNLTGEIFSVNRLAKICNEKNILLLCDGAQSGGHVKTNLEKENISMLCLAGHKGLFAPMGTGVLAIKEGVNVCPIFSGGTGIDTFNENPPSNYPERLECGTLSLPLIAGLNEGVKYANSNISFFNKLLTEHTRLIIEGLKQIDDVKIYSKPNPTCIVSFSLKNIDSVEVADLLNKRYDIAVRGGYHCAPLAHKYFKTDTNGLVRVSLSAFNTKQEIDYFLRSIKKINND